jgi:hypothetical protein
LILSRVRADIDATTAARLATRPATPTYLQYLQPPLTLDGAVVGAADVVLQRRYMLPTSAAAR